MRTAQHKPLARIFAALDITGRTKRRREADWLALGARHKADRHAQERAREDALFQARAAEREQDRAAVQRQIDAWNRMQPKPQQAERDGPARSKAGRD